MHTANRSQYQKIYIGADHLKMKKAGSIFRPAFFYAWDYPRISSHQLGD
jgi:hypothetical protein